MGASRISARPFRLENKTAAAEIDEQQRMGYTRECTYLSVERAVTEQS
jgi:hypothetical protein